MMQIAPCFTGLLYDDVWVVLKTEYSSPFHRNDIVLHVLFSGNLRVNTKAETGLGPEWDCGP